MLLHEVGIQILQFEELTSQINHRTHIAILIFQHHARNAIRFRHPVIIRTKRSRNVNNTRTILSRHIVARNHTERTLSRIYPRNKLLIVHTDQLRTLPLADHAERDQLITRFVVRQSQIGCLRVEIGGKQIFRQDRRHRHTGIRIVGLNGHIGNVRAYAKCCVRRQSPRCSSPSQEIGITKAGHLRLRIENQELSRTGRILHVAITTRLVQLMGTQTRTSRRRIGLDRITFIEQALLIELFQEIPQGLDVAVIVGDIRIIHIHPVAHLLRQVLPLFRELHDIAATSGIVFSHRYLLTNILLRNAQRLLYT